MRFWYLFLFLSLLLGTVAEAEETETSVKQPPASVSASPPSSPPLFGQCKDGTWRLTGAELQAYRGSQASYREEWTPILEKIAQCTLQKEMENACVNVRGHSDVIPFTKAIVAAFGSSEAAQMARARGRAISVVSRLHEFGVAANRLHEIPPPTHPTFRGVEISLIPDCLRAERKAIVKQVQNETVLSEETVEAIARRIQAESGARVATSDSKPVRHRFWAEAGLDFSLTLADQSDGFVTFIWLGAGWDNETVYARLNVAPGFGTPVEQRFNLEFSGSLGYILPIADKRWEVGATAGVRVSHESLNSPWLEHTWFIGLEGAQRLFKLWGCDVFLRETLVPLGNKTRRGVVTDGVIEQIPETSSNIFSLDAGLILRRNF